MRSPSRLLVCILLSLALAAPVFAAKVHLTFLYFGNPDEQKQWANTCKMYSDSQDKIEVEYIPCANDAYTQRILTLFASHDSPDTFYARNGETPVLLKNNRLLDLTQLIKADPNFKLTDYVNFDQIDKPYIRDGHIYAIHDNDNPMVLYFNRTMLDSLGPTRMTCTPRDSGRGTSSRRSSRR